MGESPPALLPTERRRSSRDLSKIIFDSENPEQFIRTVPAQSLLVLCDDIDLPLGTPRLRKSGSAGTHNGLKSITELLGIGIPLLRSEVYGQTGFTAPQPGDDVITPPQPNTGGFAI